MKFVQDQEADDTLDLVCRMCPMHLLVSSPGAQLRQADSVLFFPYPFGGLRYAVRSSVDTRVAHTHRRVGAWAAIWLASK